MTCSENLMYKLEVITQVNVLGALTAANRALRAGKDRGQCSLRIAKISQEFSNINHLLNHS